MGRIYSAVFTAQAVTAVQDLFSIVAPATATVVVHALTLAQYTEFGDAQEEQFSIQVKTGATTAGSGGAAVTPVPNMLGDTAFGGTVRRNDTTVASAGTIVTRHSDAWNIRSPYVWIPTPEIRWRLPPSARLVVGLVGGTPADSITMNGTIYFESV